MSCDNEATYFVERGFGFKEITTRCGSTTNQRGHVVTVFCDKCEADEQKMLAHEQRVRLADEDNAWLASAGWGEI
tara:strand:+ start:671 stop:895 length:225 start_codon:yes stop_codon:yes gene_type:complete